MTALNDIGKIEIFKFDDVFVNSEGLHLKNQFLPFVGYFFTDRLSDSRSYRSSCILKNIDRKFKKRDDSLFHDAVDFPFNNNSNVSPIYGLGCKGLQFDCYGLLWWTIQQLRAFESFDVNNKILLRTVKTYVNDVNFHFKRLGFDQVRALQPNKSYYIKKLFYGESKEHPSHFSQEGVEWIRKKYVWQNPDIDLNKTTKRLYLSRNNYWRRFTLNEDEFMPFLKDNNFKILDGTESQNEQIEHFRNAEIIIAPSGSMLKNTIFCTKNPLVIEIAGKEWDKKYGSWEFEINALDFGLTNYKKILVEPVQAHDIILPIEKIKQILKSFI